MIKEILKQLCDNDTVQKLLSAEYQVDTKDPETLIFRNDNSSLKVKVTDNSLSFSYRTKVDDTRNEFAEICDKIDDETFDEICELYTDTYGKDSLTSLNKNLNKETSKEFYGFAIDVLNNKVQKLNKYINLLKSNI